MLTEITAVITFARRSSGVRAVRTAMIGPLMSGVKSVAAKSATNDDGPRRQEREAPRAESTKASDREAGQAQRRDLPHGDDRDDAPDQGARAPSAA